MPRPAITVQIRAALPVPVRDLPALQRAAERAARAHDADVTAITMTQDGTDLVLTYETTAT